MKKLFTFIFLFIAFAQSYALEGRFKQGASLEYASINSDLYNENGLSLYKRKQVIFFRNDTAYVVAVSKNSNLAPFWVAKELESLPVDDQFAYDDYRDEIIFSSVGKLYQSFWKDESWTYQKKVKMEGINVTLPKSYDLSKGDPRQIKKIFHPTMAKHGERIYFAAYSKGKTDLDLWYSDRGYDNIWKAPIRLDINTDANEEHPFVVGDTLLYFASNRASNRRSNLYFIDLRAENPVAQVSVLSQPNSDEIGMVCVDNRVHIISNRNRNNPNGVTDDNIFKADLPDKVIVEKPIAFTDIEEVIPKDTTEVHPIIFQEMEDKIIVDVDTVANDSMMNTIIADIPNNTKADKVTANVYKLGNKAIFYFDLNDDQLKKLYDNDLDALVQFIKEHPKHKFLVSGFTDVRGTVDYNNALSLRRAKTVYDRLATKGISKKRMMFTGFGKRYSGLVVKDAKTEEQHQMNRRVEVIAVKRK